MTAPGLILAAPGSGSGKTTITLGLARAFRRQGLRIATAKTGPDYIDPGFHAVAAERSCINLDPWAMRTTTLASLTAQLSAGADLVLCEGVMGLFDGVDAAGTGSTAELAAMTGWPVILVVDARGMGASAAALIHGLAHPPAPLANSGLRIAGVIFNRVGTPRHAELLYDALAQAAPEIAALGAVSRHPALISPERHLGLVPAGERTDIGKFIDAAASVMEREVAMDRLRALAAPAKTAAAPADKLLPPLAQHIAIAHDAACAFAYAAVLDAWREAGATLSFFSPLADQAPAATSEAIYLPGGYPELHAGRLAAAVRFLDGLRAAAARGAVIYGECGGYMVLGRGLIDARGERHAMAGLLPVETSFAERRLHLGYRRAALAESGPLGAAGTMYRGHEFHYASLVEEGGAAALFTVADAAGRTLPAAGRRIGNVAGSFVHLIDREIV